GVFEVDMDWRDGALVRAAVRTGKDGPCRVRYAKPLAVTAEGQPVEVSCPEPGVAVFEARAGRAYEMTPAAETKTQ
ncbi:MAG TPA: hypothetical protein PKJ78_03740, partial [Candidatus Hydrogenedentes bacterium]|nr:hypothetical protein [Candidatus Hydrogenedentota bacterium]